MHLQIVQKYKRINHLEEKGTRERNAWTSCWATTECRKRDNASSPLMPIPAIVHCGVRQISLILNIDPEASTASHLRTSGRFGINLGTLCGHGRGKRKCNERTICQAIMELAGVLEKEKKKMYMSTSLPGRTAAINPKSDRWSEVYTSEVSKAGEEYGC
ncbi:hypothetical protein B0H17DRAFT_1132924 [Mycena rosella]|uniref:Uncharacterized protein n=1 Tax=Mycena rosella TaxID=1033263 RepID=A0AAD7DIV3_MYCRO|nr:hypothetical protein B0H17DRAFT_1132924 [Mycena rosella]